MHSDPALQHKASQRWTGGSGGCCRLRRGRVRPKKLYLERMRGLLIAAAIALSALSPAAMAEPAAELLGALPKAVKTGLSPLFSGNAIGQAGLNGQLQGTPDSVFSVVKQALVKAGYSEQPIRTTKAGWGFSATWAVPAGISVDATPSGKTAVLVTQATALGPDRVNLNIRFEGI